MIEKTRSTVELLAVCTVIAAGIIWIVLYEMCIRDYLDWQFRLDRFFIYGHCLLFVGIPLFIGYVVYLSWRITKHILGISRPKGL